MRRVFSDSFLRIFYPVLHAVSMLLLLAGLYLCWVFPFYTIPHLIGVIWMVSFHVRFGYCPLTKLEKDTMQRLGLKPYEHGFYQHYLFRSILGREVSDDFARRFMIVSKVLPGLVPIIYPFIR